jgi:hypothetical protein
VLPAGLVAEHIPVTAEEMGERLQAVYTVAVVALVVMRGMVARVGIHVKLEQPVLAVAVVVAEVIVLPLELAPEAVVEQEFWGKEPTALLAHQVILQPVVAVGLVVGLAVVCSLTAAVNGTAERADLMVVAELVEMAGQQQAGLSAQSVLFGPATLVLSHLPAQAIFN